MFVNNGLIALVSDALSLNLYIYLYCLYEKPRLSDFHDLLVQSAAQGSVYEWPINFGTVKYSNDKLRIDSAIISLPQECASPCLGSFDVKQILFKDSFAPSDRRFMCAEFPMLNSAGAVSPDKKMIFFGCSGLMYELDFITMFPTSVLGIFETRQTGSTFPQAIEIDETPILTDYYLVTVVQGNLDVRKYHQSNVYVLNESYKMYGSDFRNPFMVEDILFVHGILENKCYLFVFKRNQLFHSTIIEYSGDARWEYCNGVVQCKLGTTDTVLEIDETRFIKLEGLLEFGSNLGCIRIKSTSANQEICLYR